MSDSPFAVYFKIYKFGYIFIGINILSFTIETGLYCQDLEAKTFINFFSKG